MGKRIFLYIKDLQTLTGNTYKSSQVKYQQIKDALGKKANQHITIKEYCEYEGISETEVHQSLGL
ncbi:MAG: hypothetical protein AB7G44_07130 [Bacteroidia bacterium]